MGLKYLHTMVRVTDLDVSMDFYCNKLGLEEVVRWDYPDDKFTLVMLAAPGDPSAQVELTYNYDPEKLDGGRNFGHLAYSVGNIYELCQRLLNAGVTINRPPRNCREQFHTKGPSARRLRVTWVTLRIPGSPSCRPPSNPTTTYTPRRPACLAYPHKR